MSYVMAVPEALAAVAADAARIGAAITEANNAATAPTTAALAAGLTRCRGDRIGVFRQCAGLPVTQRRGVGIHSQFVRALTAAGVSYASAEAANASPLQTL